jgi:hypothetical protein
MKSPINQGVKRNTKKTTTPPTDAELYPERRGNQGVKRNTPKTTPPPTAREYSYSTQGLTPTRTSSKTSPNKQLDGIAGAMTGAFGGATNLGVQPGQMQQNPYPNQNALGSAQATKIPGMFPGSAFMQNQKTYGILSAKNSTEAAASEAKRQAAQKKAREEKAAKEKAKAKKEKAAKNNVQDPVSGKTKKQ